MARHAGDRQAAPLWGEQLEADWQRTVVDLARQLGWTVYHTYNSRRSAHGFPDLVLVRERVIWLELKRQVGKLTDPQKDWLRKLQAAGQDALVVRPSDLEALGRLLSARLVVPAPLLSDLGAATRDEVGSA